ncbi:MAG: hypothetical protein IKF14_18395 [Atopobiaceae bacterium]|nr:hypothetical protein [Atopobiaceae bacterium]MBR3161060.1 hypothetical protein [Atopobiaceae bacterium]
MNYYPYQYQQTPQPQQFDNVVTVTGIDGANAFRIGPNSRAILVDGNEDVVYLKTTDGGGFPTLRAFSIKERPLNGTGTSQYVTRQELDDVLGRMAETLSARIAENISGMAANTATNMTEEENVKQHAQQRLPAV